MRTVPGRDGVQRGLDVRNLHDVRRRNLVVDGVAEQVVRRLRREARDVHRGRVVPRGREGPLDRGVSRA